MLAKPPGKTQQPALAPAGRFRPQFDPVRPRAMLQNVSNVGAHEVGDLAVGQAFAEGAQRRCGEHDVTDPIGQDNERL